MVSIWLNEKELQILQDCLATLGEGYWMDEETDEEMNKLYEEVKAMRGKIYRYLDKAERK